MVDEGVSEGKAQAGPGRMVDVPSCESCGQSMRV